MRNLRSINLNVLPVLRAVLRFRQVSQAARALNMSQSAVSETLASLRRTFDDELLVQQDNQFRLTALAERIERQLGRSLKPLDALIGSELLGYRAKREVNIAINDYVQLAIGRPLLERAARERPDLTVRVHPIEPSSSARLAIGSMDFLMSPEIPLGLVDTEFQRAHLFDDVIECLVRHDSPIGETVTEAQFWDAQHVLFSPDPGIYSPSRTTVLQHVGDRKGDTVLVENYALVPYLVANSDRIALISSKLLRHMLPMPNVRRARAPFDIKIRVFAYWDGSRAADPVDTWFLDILTDVARSAPD